MSDLRAVVVIDYQNVHLTGHQRFEKTKYGPKHEALVDPLFFAQQLLLVRNARQRPGYPHAVLRQLDVYRGEPSRITSRRRTPGIRHREPIGSGQARHGDLRPLKYRYEYDGDGKAFRDPVTGIKIPFGPPSEKGVDVLSALALMRHSLRADVDLVILASLDSDLVPAIDEVLSQRTAKIETFSWYVPGDNAYELRPTDRTQWIWNTRLTETNFLNCLDRNEYN